MNQVCRKCQMQALVLLLCMLPTATFAVLMKKKEPPPAWDANLYQQDKGVTSTHLEFLYWRTLEGGLIYALKMNANPWNPADTFPVGHYRNARYKMDPGFRVGLSYFRAPKYWEVWGMYTRMTSRGQQQASPPTNPNEFLNAVWPTYLGALIQAKSQIHLNYNLADLLVDRYFNPNPHLRLRLLGGITGTWLSQNWIIRYLDNSHNITRVRNQWKFGGCGLRTGLYADWYWTNYIYLTFRGTIAALVGPYMNRVFQTTSAQPGPNYNPSLPIRNVTYRDTRTATHLQLILGPSWQNNWSSIRTELFAGYELNNWFNIQEIYHSLGGSASAPKEPWVNIGTLTLHGLTARFTADY